MRHAGEGALDHLEPMLRALRAMPALREKARGTFYRGSRAFIHFHEDVEGLFADVRFGEEFERIDVTTRSKQEKLVRRVRSSLQRALTPSPTCR